MTIQMAYLTMGAEWRCVSMEPMLLSAMRDGMTRMLLLCAVFLAMDHLFTVSLCVCGDAQMCVIHSMFGNATRK